MASDRSIRVLYFARLRDRIGLESEAVELPDDVVTVADVMALLAQRSDAHAEAFADVDTIRAALDQQHAEMDAPVAVATEVAFFPPMTGG